MVSTVTMTINGQTYTGTQSGNAWTFNALAPPTTSFNQPGGYFDVSISATNTAGTKTTISSTDPTFGPSLRLRVLERVAPTITVISPSEAAYIGTNTPTITFALRDEVGGSGIKIDTLSVVLNGTTITGITISPVSNGYDCSFVTSVLSDGLQTLIVNVSDNDGNAATQITRRFTVDTAPPVLSISSPIQNLITPTAALTIMGITNDAISPAVTVKITLNGLDQGAVTVDASGNFSKAVTLSEGANTIVVTSTDTVGKYATITRNVVLDTTVPQFSSVTITPNPADAGATMIVSVVVS